mgnify:CR=1 FL=1
MHLQPLRLATRDAATAEEFMRQRLTGVETVEFGPRFALEVNGVRGDGFSVKRLTHTSTVRVATARTNHLHVLELLRGSARLVVAGADTSMTPGQVVALDAEAPARLYSDRASLGLVTLSREMLAAAADVPASRLSFPDPTPVSAESASLWRAAVRHTNRDVLANQHAVSHPRMVADSMRELAEVALETFDHEVADDTPARGPGAIRRAKEYIDRHADRPLTVGDIAEAAHTSVRALQQGFARHHDTSPTAYLRQVRLEGAHRDLIAADPEGLTTVAEVAGRWGFAQPGRFAAHYREAFGILPSESLRARPRS